MPSQSAAIWAGTAATAIAVVGAGALYLGQPAFRWLVPAPAVMSDLAPAPVTSANRSKPPAVAANVSAATPAAPATVKPSFDVVSVEPTGEAVIAGRAAPNAQVVLRDDGKTLAQATADASGQFVMIPSPLAPGAHSLTLETGSGQSASETSSAIAVSVPEPPPRTVAAGALEKGAATPALSSAANRTSSVASAAAGTAPDATARVAVQSVEGGAGGQLLARGFAPPNATVRLYLSGVFVGDAKTKDDGRWSLTIQHGVTPGPYVVRADEIDPANAAVIARAEAPFDYRATPSASAAPGMQVASANSSLPSSSADIVVASVQTDRVERGDTLWGISQRFYGDGSRYQLIFAANSSQIRNPSLIYPGQMFMVPKGDAKP